MSDRIKKSNNRERGFHPKLIDALRTILHEPNYEEFEYKGYLCIVKRMMAPQAFFGNLNGYVILPVRHKYHGKGHDEIDVDCHGGLTWASEASELFDNMDPDDWVMGFDCAHYGDMQPFMLLTERYMIPQFDNTAIIDDPNMTYKTFDYVKNECKIIVDQLVTGKNLSGENLEKNHTQ